MGLIVSEASAFDMLEAQGDAGRRTVVTRRRFGEMARQVSEGASLTIRDEAGALVCVMGLWPEPDHAEAWLAVGPAFRRNFRGALDRLEDALCAVACANAPLEVRVYVVGLGDRVAGARMAAWLGFQRDGTEATSLGPVAVFTRFFGGAPRHG